MPTDSEYSWKTLSQPLIRLSLTDNAVNTLESEVNSSGCESIPSTFTIS